MKNKTSAMRLVMLLLCLPILLTAWPSCAAMAEPIIIYEDPDLIGNIEEDMSEVVTALATIRTLVTSAQAGIIVVGKVDGSVFIVTIPCLDAATAIYLLETYAGAVGVEIGTTRE